MTALYDLIPELPRTFDLVEGELVQGRVSMAVRVVFEDEEGMLAAEVLPVRAIVEIEGRATYVSWAWVLGWPGAKVAGWAR